MSVERTPSCVVLPELVHGTTMFAGPRTQAARNASARSPSAATRTSCSGTNATGAHFRTFSAGPAGERGGRIACSKRSTRRDAGVPLRTVVSFDHERHEGELAPMDATRDLPTALGGKDHTAWPEPAGAVPVGNNGANRGRRPVQSAAGDVEPAGHLRPPSELHPDASATVEEAAAGGDNPVRPQSSDPERAVVVRGSPAEEGVSCGPRWTSRSRERDRAGLRLGHRDGSGCLADRRPRRRRRRRRSARLTGLPPARTSHQGHRDGDGGGSCESHGREPPRDRSTLSYARRRRSVPLSLRRQPVVRRK
jgi:hypothetical protein